MINDRNRLSHIYNQKQFNEIYGRLSEYLKLMNHVIQSIESPL